MVRSCFCRSRLAWGIGAVVALLILGISLNSWGQQRRPRGRRVVEVSTLFDGNPPHHVGEYPAFNVVWQKDARVRDVQGVFPDPVAAQRVVVATGAGLVISGDAGKNWKELPGTAPAVLGEVRHVEFAVDGSAAIYVASASKGVWQITDPAKAPVQIGSKGTGLLSDSVMQVRVDTGDPLFKTLLAVHGSDAGGISRSQDGGRTWHGVPGVEDYFIDKLFCGGPGLSWAFAMASLKDPTGSRGIYFCLSVGDFFKDYGGNVQATDAAVDILFEHPFEEANDLSFWSTESSGLLRTDHNGTHTLRIGPGDIERWSSVGVTYGATADSRIIYAYEPTKLGMAVSQDDGQTFAAFSNGLPSGGFVKQGAQVRANAGGSVFFAAINNALYVGRRYTGLIGISDIRVMPATMSYAPNRYVEAFNQFGGQVAGIRDQHNAAASAPEAMAKFLELKDSANELAFSISARISEPDEGGADAAATRPDGEKPPISVTVDLSRVGGSTVTPMYDDGLHGDGAANDGVYGARCMIRPDRLRNFYQDHRRPTPGPMALTITAVSPSGTLSSAVGVVSLLERVETHAYWVPTMRNEWKESEGDVDVALGDYLAAGDERALKITTKDKAWSVPLVNYYSHSILGYQALSFDVKTDGKPLQELYVQLKDSSPDTVPAETVRVGVVKEGLVEGGAIDQKYHRVVVPFSLLMKDPPEGTARFRPTMLHAVVISGDGEGGRNLWISAIHFHAAGEDAKASDKKGGER